MRVDLPGIDLMTHSLYSVEDEKQAIWVYLEQENEALAGVSGELLTKGRQLADQSGWLLGGLLMGDRCIHLAEEAIARGADEVIVAEDPLMKFFTVDAYSHVAFHLLMGYKPSVFLLGATPDGRDLAGRLAVRLRTGLSADCTGLYLPADTGVLVSEVSGFGRGILALIEMERHRPQMATVRPGVFIADPPRSGREGQILVEDVPLTRDMIKTRVVEREVGQGVNLTQTPVLVAGGRGVDGDFEMLAELADLLNGEVGATRPPVDEGLIERDRQVGQTGVVCRPKVAIACGISGAFHFIVGIQQADTVIAINTDPEAPIFDYADYCVVGDVHEIVPALIQTLKNPADPNAGAEVMTRDGRSMSGSQSLSPLTGSGHA